MTPTRVLRRFSLLDDRLRRGGGIRGRRRRGGRNKFTQFLASLGHTVRPFFKLAEKALINKGKEKLAQKIGSEAVNSGTRILTDLVKNKSLKAAVNSEDGRDLLRKGVEGIKTRISGGSGFNLPSDLDQMLFAKNKENLSEAVQPTRRRRKRRRKASKSAPKRQEVLKGAKAKSRKGSNQGTKKKTGGKTAKKRGSARKAGPKKGSGRKRGSKKGSGRKQKSKGGSKKVRFNLGGQKKGGSSKGSKGSSPKVGGRKGGVVKSIFD